MRKYANKKNDIETMDIKSTNHVYNHIYLIYY